MRSDRPKIYNIALMSLYTASFVVLSKVGTIDLNSIKLTSQNLPIYIAAMTMGMAPGALVGFLGMFISQIITYGFTATTLLWVLPQTIIGAVCGYVFERKKFKLTNIKYYVVIILLQLLLTCLNTMVYAIDGLVFGYYNYMLIYGPFLIKIMVSFLTGMIYCIVLPLIVNLIKKIH